MWVYSLPNIPDRTIEKRNIVGISHDSPLWQCSTNVEQNEVHCYYSPSSSSASMKATTDTPMSTSSKSNHLSTVNTVKKRLRERGRINQRNYRQRQVQFVKSKENDNVRLQHEIQKLEILRCNLVQFPSLKRNVWAVATEYCQRFCQAIDNPTEAHYSASLEFLRNSMAYDVRANTAIGVEAILKSWRLFYYHFDDVSVQLDLLRKIAENLLVAVTTTTIVISANTLERALPHLNGDEKGGLRGGQWSPLAGRLLNRHLVVSGSVTFVWDEASEHVVSVQRQWDMLTPLLRLLGSMGDVSRVFEGAFVSLDGQFIAGSRT